MPSCEVGVAKWAWRSGRGEVFRSALSYLMIPTVWEGYGFTVTNATHTLFLSEGQMVSCESLVARDRACILLAPPMCLWWLLPRAVPRAPPTLQDSRSPCNSLTPPLQLVLGLPLHRESYGAAQSHSPTGRHRTGTGIVSAMFGVLRCPSSLRALCNCQDSQVVLPPSSPSLRDNPIMN